MLKDTTVALPAYSRSLELLQTWMKLSYFKPLFFLPCHGNYWIKKEYDSHGKRWEAALKNRVVSTTQLLHKSCVPP